MRATCQAADLPKLKPFPWERIFAPNTPSEASDLAQRLLRYDPDQRLSAPQALAHPFFDGAQELVERSPTAAGAPASAPRSSSSNPTQRLEQWETSVARHFDELVRREHLLPRAQRDALLRHAVEAAQVALFRE